MPASSKPFMVHPLAGRIHKTPKQHMDVQGRFKKLGGSLLKQATETRTMNDLCNAFARMKGPDAQLQHDVAVMLECMESCRIGDGESGGFSDWLIESLQDDALMQGGDACQIVHISEGDGLELLYHPGGTVTNYRNNSNGQIFVGRYPSRGLGEGELSRLDAMSGSDDPLFS
ncbi:hypothetical protein DOTSEDRAFT_24949 [Dothistroma septosporum NZE10]|uniref:Uncharacterized protein n=1 Tax=Dothistroma septosporum (strain NZE10 / CBS 128990) TaxID=675120 RepID=M2XKD6_DOTSN|nr:hypothetical protein DOTSEDRAFT_24949 [Dothistroma septosporum NZE10]